MTLNLVVEQDDEGRDVKFDRCPGDDLRYGKAILTVGPAEPLAAPVALQVESRQGCVRWSGGRGPIVVCVLHVWESEAKKIAPAFRAWKGPPIIGGDFNNNPGQPCRPVRPRGRRFDVGFHVRSAVCSTVLVICASNPPGPTRLTPSARAFSINSWAIRTSIPAPSSPAIDRPSWPSSSPSTMILSRWSNRSSLPDHRLTHKISDRPGRGGCAQRMWCVPALVEAD